MFPVVYSAGPTSSTTAEIYMQTDENTAYLEYYTVHNFGTVLVKVVYSIHKLGNKLLSSMWRRSSCHTS